MEPDVSQEKVIDDLYLFLRTVYHYERNIARRFDLNYQEIYLLQSLRRSSPQRLTEIARVLDIPMFAASRLVGRLLKNHLVAKEKGAHDRRSISVSLLPEGEKIVQTIETDSYAQILKGTSEMSKDEFSGLLRMVEKLYRILGLPADLVH